jgi:hypothetical protein
MTGNMAMAVTVMVVNDGGDDGCAPGYEQTYNRDVMGISSVTQETIPVMVRQCKLRLFLTKQGKADAILEEAAAKCRWWLFWNRRVDISRFESSDNKEVHGKDDHARISVTYGCQTCIPFVKR